MVCRGGEGGQYLGRWLADEDCGRGVIGRGSEVELTVKQGLKALSEIELEC